MFVFIVLPNAKMSRSARLPSYSFTRLLTTYISSKFNEIQFWCVRIEIKDKTSHLMDDECQTRQILSINYIDSGGGGVGVDGNDGFGTSTHRTHISIELDQRFDKKILKREEKIKSNICLIYSFEYGPRPGHGQVVALLNIHCK